MLPSKLNHMMIDVETLGLTPDTTVTEIGIVLFNPETGEFGQQRHYLPPVDGQGGTISFDTLRWWLKTDATRLASVLAQDPKVGVPTPWEIVSEDIAALTKMFDVDTIWAKGVDFDFPILSAAFDRTSSSNPLNAFSYRQKRCVRQWQFAAEHNGWEATSRPVDLPPHNALADAIWQARTVCSFWAYLSK